MNRRNLRLKLADLLGEKFDVVACGNPYQSEAIGVALEDVEGLRPDWPSR